MHHVWELPVAFDLFFAGLGAGLFLVAVMADLFGGARYKGVRLVGGILAPWPVLLGVALLVLDLGRPLRCWEFVLRAGPGFLNYTPSSVMSTGTWLLAIFTTVSLLYLVLLLIPSTVGSVEKLRRAVGVVGLPLALLVTIYTGVLIAGTAIPLWNTALLPILFVSSAILSGVAAIILVLGLRPAIGLEPTEEPVMGALTLGETALAGLALVLSLVYVAVVAGREGGAVHLASAAWWIFAVILGLVVPLVYGLVRQKVKVALATPAVAFLAVLGAFVLRYTILMNGQV